MKMIYKKRWGFAVMAYPVDDDDGLLKGFRAGIYDTNRDLWWFSDDVVREETSIESLALTGWREIMNDFLHNQDEFPDRTQVIDVRNEIRAEIDSVAFRLSQIAETTIIAEEGLTDEREPIGVHVSGGRGSAGPEAAGTAEGGAGHGGESRTTKEVHSSGVQGVSEESDEVPGQGVVDDPDSTEPEHEHIPSEESAGQELRVTPSEEPESGPDGEGDEGSAGGTGDSEGAEVEHSGGEGKSGGK